MLPRILGSDEQSAIDSESSRKLCPNEGIELHTEGGAIIEVMPLA